MVHCVFIVRSESEPEQRVHGADLEGDVVVELLPPGKGLFLRDVLGLGRAFGGDVAELQAQKQVAALGERDLQQGP